MPRIVKDLKQLPKDATDEQARRVFSNLLRPPLAVNKSPDFIVNKGHYFGTSFLPRSEGEKPLANTDKKALFEYLKTMQLPTRN